MDKTFILVIQAASWDYEEEHEYVEISITQCGMIVWENGTWAPQFGDKEGNFEHNPADGCYWHNNFQLINSVIPEFDREKWSIPQLLNWLYANGYTAQ